MKKKMLVSVYDVVCFFFKGFGSFRFIDSARYIAA